MKLIPTPTKCRARETGESHCLRSQLSAVSSVELADGCAAMGVSFRSSPAWLEPAVSSMRCYGRLLTALVPPRTTWLTHILSIARPGDIVMTPQPLPEVSSKEFYALRSAGVRGLLMCANPVPSHLQDLASLPVFGRRRGTPAVSEPQDPCCISNLLRVPVEETQYVVADDDGVVIVSQAEVLESAAAARRLQRINKSILEAMCSGRSLRSQTDFSTYLSHKKTNPSYSFGAHLRKCAPLDNLL